MSEAYQRCDHRLNSLSTGMRPGVPFPVMMLTAMVASFYINPKLALVVLCGCPGAGHLHFLFLIISHVRPLYGVMQGAIDHGQPGSSGKQPPSV